MSSPVVRQDERDALTDVLARMEAKHGPVNEAAVNEIFAQLNE